MKKNENKMPSQTMLLALFRYDPENGVLKRRGTPSGPCGRKVSIHNQDHWSARIIWKMMTGREPVVVVDFHDGNQDNRRWSNLVELTKSQLRLKGGAHQTSKTGYRGVYPVAGGYRAQIWFRGAKVHVGTFKTARTASEAREKRRRELMRIP